MAALPARRRLLFRLFVVVQPSPYKTARLQCRLLERSRSPFDRRFSAVTPSIRWEYPFDELLVIGLLGQGRGVEIHGCGVVDRDSTGNCSSGSRARERRRWRGCGSERTVR